jgi:hypothetical protein
MRLGSSIRRRRKPEGTESLWKRIIPAWIREDGDGKSRWAVLKEPWVLGSLVALSVVGFAGGYLISTRVVYPPPPPPGDLFALPDLTGLTPDAAADTLSTLGLVLGAVDSMAHPVAPTGQIIGQSPLPGQETRPGRAATEWGPGPGSAGDFRIRGHGGFRGIG